MKLAHFAGEPSAAFQSMSMTPAAVDAAWSRLVEGLGLASAREGHAVRSSAGAPPVAGRVEHVGPAQHPELLLRLEAPAPGLASLFDMPMGGMTCLVARCFFYGDGAGAVASREESRWQAWMSVTLPQDAAASQDA